MNEAPQGEVTRLLRRWAAGDSSVANEAIPLLHDELHRIAVGYFRRERRAHTLQPTAIINEAWIQLLGSGAIQETEVAWQSRVHFLGVAARVMRRVLVDHGRAHRALKRGGGTSPVRLRQLEELPAGRSREARAVDDALHDLERFDPEGARLVELRFFGGLTIDETAAFLGLSRKTTVRHWRRVRAWLHDQLNASEHRETARVD